MRARWVVSVAFAVFFAALATPAAAEPKRSIVRIQSGLNGWSKVQTLCALLGCQVVRSLDTLPGVTAPSSLFLLYNLPDTLPLGVTLVGLGVSAVESDLPVTVECAGGGCWGADQATAGVLDSLWDRVPVTYYGATAWRSYLQQPAGDIVRVRDTHCTLGATGGATVAVIDTGVDRDHPTLQAFLTEGYDFTRNQDGGDEGVDVDQATSGVLDGIYSVNQGTAAALDQATAGVLDDSGSSHFGHGTQVAGVVHLVAPTATIMPLKAFSASGEAYTSDIVRAVYYAVGRGAKVINMSFSRATPSEELRRAIDYATSHGLIAVASAGNNGQSLARYPAAYSNVMSVASTANDDTRSSFSNYGSTVWVAAPGEGIVTTYPWGSFAAAWGTSFSTPMVSGAAALLAGLKGTATFDQVSSAMAHAVSLTPELGHGRLDLYQVVEAGRALWPEAPTGEVPESCSSLSVDWSPAVE
jgi:subtilase family protein